MTKKAYSPPSWDHQKKHLKMNASLTSSPEVEITSLSETVIDSSALLLAGVGLLYL